MTTPLKTTAQAEWESRAAELQSRLNYWNNRESDLLALMNDCHEKIGMVHKLINRHNEQKPNEQAQADNIS
jgi:hypothetical protein